MISRSTKWQWWVSGLLLLATMINYMDRQTLSNLSVRITERFQLTNQQYGNLEFLFGVAFAFGSLFFGFLADRVSVRLLYPVVLVSWSAVGFLTGFTQGYQSLMICRGLLGFFEAGHWPCALIVTQAVMARGDRVMGNSLLQSGASLGAIITPLVIGIMVTGNTHGDAWRMPFFVIGSIGVLWSIAWLVIMQPADLPNPRQLQQVNSSSPLRSHTQVQAARWFVDTIRDRRFWALACMVICLNTSWQLVRAWLPKFLQEGRSYTEVEALYFNSAFFVATDVGCIVAGLATLWLTHRGWRIHQSRAAVYVACSMLAALTTLAAVLPQGWPLVITLLLVGAGLLGVFPCYYSFAQEMPSLSMGRMTGMLSFIGWIASSPTQSLFGVVIDQTHSYDLGLAVVGWSPLVGFILFYALWPTENRHSRAVAADGRDLPLQES